MLLVGTEEEHKRNTLAWRRDFTSFAWELLAEILTLATFVDYAPMYADLAKADLLFESFLNDETDRQGLRMIVKRF